VPNSRLIVYSPPGSHRERAQSILAAQEIDPQRITFVGRMKFPEYFAQYQRSDIALDPFPFVGGTTTCDALWMGVPVITLAGDTATGRGGVSLLSNVGLPELIARDPEEYLKIAKDLAADLPRLVHLRATLRNKVRQSPLMDASSFARDVEAAYRQMWTRWCSSGS
jgi:protein O-GlcNAc transferase